MQICNPAVSNQYVKTAKVIIKPNPLELKPNAKVTFGFELELIKEIPVGAKVSVEILAGPHQVKIACFNYDVSNTIKNSSRHFDHIKQL